MFSTSHTRILGYVFAGLLPFFSACEEDGGSFIAGATLDPESVVLALTPTVNGLTMSDSVENTPIDGGSTLPIENTGEIEFLRSGLEDVLGHNKLEWTYTSNEVPPVTERYFFQERDIILDEDGDPQILQRLPPINSGILVLYMELGDGVYGIHTFARIYQDASVVVNMFASEGRAESAGIFVYCLPSEDLVACIESILTEWDGTMTYQRSPSPIALTDAELSGAHVTNPIEAAAWMQAARESNPKAETHAAFKHKDTPATIEAISAAIEAYRFR